MIQPPNIKPKIITRSELERLFKEGNWEERLKLCRAVLHYESLSGTTVLYEYWHPEEGYIALICYHRRTDKSLSEPHPKLLLIDGVWHAC